MRASEFLTEDTPPALINKTVNTDGIQLSINADGANVSVYALANGRRLGYVVFDRDGRTLVADDLAIDEKYQGQGIAKIMYDYVKNALGFDIQRSWNQTPAGKGFWNKNRGEEETVWEAEQTPAEQFITDVYDEYPQTFQNNHVMPFSSEEFAMFELKPSTSKRGAVELYWFQAYPLRSGVGSRAMQVLQSKAREHGVALTLVPWDKGQVSQAALTKFYKRQGFKPVMKGGRSMSWEPELDECRIVEYSLFDLHHDFFEEINQLDISLFENKDDYLKLKNILNDFSTPAPTIGRKYIYTSVAATPAGKMMNIAHFTQPYQLIDIKDGRYHFNINGTRRIFPEQGSVDKQDSYQHIFMFDTVKDFEKMLGWININYSDDNQWRVGSKKLDEGIKDWIAALAATGAMALGTPADAARVPQAPQIQSVEQVSQVLAKPVAQVLKKVAIANGITGTELAQFMAQCAHETANFSTLKEIGGKLDFKKYDPKYAPKKAKALGNVKPGDGARYAGRGYIQLTGRDNYKRAGQALGLPLEQRPELVERPDVAAKVAVWFWQNRVAPKVASFHDTKQVTKPINPGMRGIADRQAKFNAIKQGAMATPKDMAPRGRKI